MEAFLWTALGGVALFLVINAALRIPGQRLQYKLPLILGALVALGAPKIAFAALPDSNPTTVCAYLADLDLSTRGWKNYYDSEYGCSSPYKEFGTGAPLKNNLAYYAEGKRQKADRLKLVLNVNNRRESAAAHEELLAAAEVLIQKVLGASLPPKIASAIEKGTKANVELAGTTIELTRVNWPTGKGYELKLHVE